MEKVYIYTLSDPISEEVRYLGKTNNIKRRYTGHLNSKNKNKVTSWTKSLLKKGLKPNIEILDEVPNENWKFWEKWWISILRSWNVNLTNLTSGGEGWASGNLNPSSTPEGRARISKLKKGHRMSDEQKKKISESLKGRKNPEHSKRLKGRKLSSKHKEKIKKGMSGKNALKFSKEDVNLINTILENDNMTLSSIANKFNFSYSYAKGLRRKYKNGKLTWKKSSSGNEWWC